MPKKKKSLSWEYCECGCHGSELRIGGLYFWSLIEFPVKGNYDIIKVHLNDGHKWGTHLGTWKNIADRDKFVRDILSKKLKELKEVI